MIVCKFCELNNDEAVKAVIVAPQCEWNQDNIVVEWVPTCEACYEGWWDSIPADKRLPVFRLDHDGYKENAP